MCKCLLNLANEYLHWPSEAKFRNIKQKFTTLRVGHSFPNVVGAVDGMHIPIPAPMEDSASYYNRKGFYSIILQGICDAECKFIDVFVGWPGSSHDARVWRESPIGCGLAEDNLRLPEGTHLLGDSAYPLHSYLMTPFRDNGHLSPRQSKYNTKLSSKRIVIEQTYGLLKGRFRRLQFLNMFLMNEMQTVVITCCILHNICIVHNDTYECDDYEEENQQNDEQADRGNALIAPDGAADKRNEIVDFLYLDR
ncbi:putative nuclease HARBI1 [Mycetomoellerius zeteki]|uniref:putative nuclease HARBI1 n=1 Tax=Mycetomoellerius zeteki TaxID=64791 RepID=UPI00084E95B6|nr:PREDICTED: putative nuclease HARBI1 [Trachymyrmex zeteki]